MIRRRSLTLEERNGCDSNHHIREDRLGTLLLGQKFRGYRHHEVRDLVVSGPKNGRHHARRAYAVRAGFQANIHAVEFILVAPSIKKTVLKRI